MRCIENSSGVTLKKKHAKHRPTIEKKARRRMKFVKMKKTKKSHIEMCEKKLSKYVCVCVRMFFKHIWCSDCSDGQWRYIYGRLFACAQRKVRTHAHRRTFVEKNALEQKAAMPLVSPLFETVVCSQQSKKKWRKMANCRNGTQHKTEWANKKASEKNCLIVEFTGCLRLYMCIAV